MIGVVVAELSTGLAGGIGRLIIEYSRESTSDPAKVFTAVFGAAALGLAMAGLVGVDRPGGVAEPPTEGRARVSAVEIRDVSKVFNAGRPNAVEALVDIDLTIEPGEFVSLIGPSGCGKSTAAPADREPPGADDRRDLRERQAGATGAARPGLRHGVPAGGPVRMADA